MCHIIAVVLCDKRVKIYFTLNGTPEYVIKSHSFKTYGGADALTSDE